MKPSIQSKLPHAGTTIFTTMSVLAQENNAINLGQGFPDFPMSAKLVELVNQAMQKGQNQYVHMNGLPALRKSIAEKVMKLYESNLDAETEITITPGGTYAIYTALTAIIQPGDEVIVFEPAYDSYIPNIEINGGIAVPVSLIFPTYAIDWDLVKTKVNSRTKAIIINSPHNPSGYVLTEDDIIVLQKIVAGTGIFIISDEVYEHIIFDDKKHLSLLKYPDLYERSFICFSFGKVYHCTGWKMGYCIAPAQWMKEFRKVHQFNCFTCNAPVQYALAAFIQEEKEYLQLGKFLQQKRDFFLEQMKATPFKPFTSYGSYFQLYSYAGISDEDEQTFAERLIRENGVATIPVSAFYKKAEQHQVVRFCFAKNEGTLLEAAQRLHSVK
ncbi:MAG: methionine aminotransferase [Ferruginibacter sp.]